MATTDDELARQIKRLAGYNKDAAGAFEKAADKVDEEKFRTLFRKYHRQHDRWAETLEGQASALEGVNRDVEETPLGKLFKGWMDLKSAFSGGDAESMLDDITRMEDKLIDQYDKALDTDFPPDLQQTVSDQFSECKQALNELRNSQRFL